MVTWNNLDTLDSFDKLSKVERVNLAEVMSGENGANRVKNYSVPMAEGFTYNYAAKAVDDNVLDALVKLAEEAQLAEKFEELYNGHGFEWFRRAHPWKTCKFSYIQQEFQHANLSGEYAAQQCGYGIGRKRANLQTS